MTEKSLISAFDENYGRIIKNIECAAKKSGRRYEDITLLAATKTVDIGVINHAIEFGIKVIGETECKNFYLSMKTILLVSATLSVICRPIR